jgi:hypothetical protein
MIVIFAVNAVTGGSSKVIGLPCSGLLKSLFGGSVLLD